MELEDPDDINASIPDSVPTPNREGGVSVVGSVGRNSKTQTTSTLRYPTPSRPLAGRVG